MRVENMRRWPMYVLFAICFLLLFTMFNSWSMQTVLENKIAELSKHLQDCAQQQSLCMEESLKLQEQRDRHVGKINDLEKQKIKLGDDMSRLKEKVDKAETRANQTVIDAEFCKTELESLKNLQESKWATLETLRIEKGTLTAQLAERKAKIDELEKEVNRLKLALTTKSAPLPSVPVKMTPAPQPPKHSPALNMQDPINEPVLENDAKEELEETNGNDNNEFDTNLK